MMAANILELYTKGYRNFIFIVNSTNIIRKTIANFTQKDDSKYLFALKLYLIIKKSILMKLEKF